MRLGFVLSEVGQGLRRNASMVVSVVLVTFVSLTFVGTAILLQFQIGQMKGYWYDRAQVAVYLCTDLEASANCAKGSATDAQKAAIEQRLSSEPLADYIASYEFENRDEAYERYLEVFGDTDEAAFITPDVLNETYWIKLVNPDDAEVIVEGMSGTAGVEEVADQRQYLSGIFSVLNAASITAAGIAALMLVAATLLIATTIRLSAFSRRRELSIMRLVGASNRFIQTPFVLEGVVAALIGSVLAGLATVGIVQFFVHGYLQEQLPATSFVSIADGVTIVPILVGIGVALAAGASSFAISRYLKA